MSDLHTELQPLLIQLENIQDGDVCILAGDITSAEYLRSNRTDADARKAQKRFFVLLDDLQRKFRHILYVMGNHEHYGSVYTVTKFTIEEFLRNRKLSKVRILDDDTMFIDDVLFVGSTLWTDFNNGNIMDMMTCHGGMNDYNWIYRDQRTTITPDYILDKHHYSRQYLQHILHEHHHVDPFEKIVVITHHAPSLQAEPRKGSPLSPAFASNLDDVFGDYNRVKKWIHGHTHYNYDYMMGEIPVVSNQYGYFKYEGCPKTFDICRSFEI
jgi:predicted phosphodiesterase